MEIADVGGEVRGREGDEEESCWRRMKRVCLWVGREREGRSERRRRKGCFSTITRSTRKSCCMEWKRKEW